jgi:hypothetical protein
MHKIISISTCFLQKINILSNKPSKTIQKFQCTLTNLNTADEVTRIDGTYIARESTQLQNLPYTAKRIDSVTEPTYITKRIDSVTETTQPKNRESTRSVWTGNGGQSVLFAKIDTDNWIDF